MNAQIQAALFRAFLGFGVAALISAQGFVAGQLDDKQFYAAVIGAAAVALTRVGEGVYDGRRDAKGNIKPGDVGYHFIDMPK